MQIELLNPSIPEGFLQVRVGTFLACAGSSKVGKIPQNGRTKR